MNRHSKNSQKDRQIDEQGEMETIEPKRKQSSISCIKVKVLSVKEKKSLIL